MVVINLEFTSLAPSPLILSDLEPLVNWNLSSVRTSVPPSDLIRMYLSSSKGRNTSLSSVLMTGVELFEIDVLYCLLITISESTRFTADTFALGNALYSALLLAWLPEPATLPVPFVESSSKFWTLVTAAGIVPSQIPFTLATASTVIFVFATPITLFRVAISNPGLEYLIILPIEAIPTNENPGSAGIEIRDSPPPAADTFAEPKLRTCDWMVSAVKVAAEPTMLKTDLTSDIRWFTSLTINLELSRTPLKSNLSPLWNSPCTFVATIEVEFATLAFKNPFAPLDSPSICVEVFSVTASLRVMVENNWTSNSDKSQLLRFGNAVS